MISESSAHRAVLRHLSGVRRGQVEALEEKTLNLLKGADMDVQALSPDVTADDGDTIAKLHRAGQTYELEVMARHTVWINGERTAGNHLLRSGDLIELGQGGPVVRFRLFPPGVVPKKTIAEVFADSVDGARADGRSAMGKTGSFLSRFTHDLATQTTLWFRIWVLVLITTLVISIAVLAVQNIRLQKHLFSEAMRIDSIAEALQKTGAQAIKKEELAKLQKVVEDRLESLEARTGELARVFASVEDSIAFVQGTFGFVDPGSGKPLRYTESPEGVYLFSVEGDGKVVELTFTGSAFLVNPEGLLMTNKHLTEPWLEDERSEAPMELGLKPEHRRMRIYFPGDTEASDVLPVFASEEADLALVTIPGEHRFDMGALKFQTDPPRPGDEVLVVGYPLGIAGMIVRASPGFIEQARQESDDFWQIVDRLAREGYIRPLASRGIVSQVSADYIVYDAETTAGGSGGPVLNADGSVVAINTAIVEKFGGSNLGVLSIYARRLMDRYLSKE